MLEERLRQFEGGLPVRLLEAESVVSSKWANRVAASFDSGAFAALKSEIAEAGGNVQPIKVRSRKGEDNRFEIVFGHRRHRACLELGLPVLAMIEEVTDADLFKQMDRENRARADLSPWEQGRMYRQALNDKIFASREQLAREIGIDPGNLSKALRLADLDEVIVGAFASPLDLQYRWAKPLADAYTHDRDRVMKVVKELGAKPGHVRNAKNVFDQLVGAILPEVRVEQVRVGKKVVAEIQTDAGRVTIRFATGAVDESTIMQLKDFISTALKI